MEKPLVILCVDGLDPRLWNEYGFSLPYESSLTIPFELYEELAPSKFVPYTPHIWGSMFLGEVLRHPDVKRTNKWRLKLRGFLRRHGVKWQRQGRSFRKHYEDSYRVFRKNVEKSVLDDYHVFKYDIPCVCEGFTFGSVEMDYEKHLVFNALAEKMHDSNYDVVALYTHYLDRMAHNINEFNQAHEEYLKSLYAEIYRLVELLLDKIAVMVVSDHGCFGEHTEHAYLGTNFPHTAETVLDVADVVVEGMNFLCVEPFSVENKARPGLSEEERRIIEERLRRLGYI